MALNCELQGCIRVHVRIESVRIREESKSNLHIQVHLYSSNPILHPMNAFAMQKTIKR